MQHNPTQRLEKKKEVSHTTAHRSASQHAAQHYPATPQDAYRTPTEVQHYPAHRLPSATPPHSTAHHRQPHSTAQHSTALCTPYHHRLYTERAHAHTRAHRLHRTCTPPRRTRTRALRTRTPAHARSEYGRTGAHARGRGERHPSVTTPETTCDHLLHLLHTRAQSVHRACTERAAGASRFNHWYNLLNHHGRTALVQPSVDLPSPEQHGLQPYSTYQ